MTNRRSFLTSLGTISGLTFLGRAEKLSAVPQRISSAASPWDLSWLDAFNGKHRQLFDFGDANITEDGHLVVVRNYLNAHKEVFGIDYPQVNALIGIAYTAYPLNASDSLWEKYPIGEKWRIKDPRTKNWAKRNIFNDPGLTAAKGSYNISGLVSRGAAFWQCNNALGAVTADLARAVGQSADIVRAELLAGMMPGVRLVPAHTMLVGLAQEHGFTYEAM